MTSGIEKLMLFIGDCKKEIFGAEQTSKNFAKTVSQDATMYVAAVKHEICALFDERAPHTSNLYMASGVVNAFLGFLLFLPPPPPLVAPVTQFYTGAMIALAGTGMMLRSVDLSCNKKSCSHGCSLS